MLQPGRYGMVSLDDGLAGMDAGAEVKRGMVCAGEPYPWPQTGEFSIPFHVLAGLGMEATSNLMYRKCIGGKGDFSDRLAYTLAIIGEEGIGM